MLFLFFTLPLPGWAAEPVGGGVEVIVPAQGLTELNLKNEVCFYQGSPKAPIEVLLEEPPMRLWAVKVTYDQGKEVLTAEEAVKLEAEKLVATGPAMVFTSEQAQLPAGGELTAYEPEIQKLVVNGEFIYRFTDQSFEGKGGFVLQGPEWTLEGERLAGSWQEGEFMAHGQLHFSSQNVWGEAETVTYYQQEDRLILTGSPFVRWEEGFLQGETDTVISLDLASGQAKVEGPTKTRFYQDGGVHPSGD
jgi:hypothetical protein